VHDGDTITVVHEGREERVRLHGMETPQRGPDFTNPAKRFDSELCYRKKVREEVKGLHRYQRTIADVILPGRPDSELRGREGRFVVQAVRAERVELKATSKMQTLGPTRSSTTVGVQKKQAGA